MIWLKRIGKVLAGLAALVARCGLLLRPWSTHLCTWVGCWLGASRGVLDDSGFAVGGLLSTLSRCSLFVPKSGLSPLDDGVLS